MPPTPSSHQSGTLEVGDLLKATIAAHRCAKHVERDDSAAARVEFRALRDVLAILRDTPEPDDASIARIHALHSDARELGAVLEERDPELEARSRPTWRPPASSRR